ncbi:MAG: hypothetical protein CMI28_01435 [Opitutae bacterium]|nr:hypothetical protein [Opitutae bacterium]
MDPAHLSRIEDFSLLAKVVVDGAMPGIHRSLRQGRGTEFFQYRPYDPGEDLKVVDWKVYAKREELVAKTFQEDTNFNLFLVLDTSASMGYQGEPANCTKLHYASMLAACFAYLAYRQGDRVGLFAYGQEVQQWIRPKSGHAHFGRVVNALAQLQAGGVNKHEAMWDQLVGNMPGRSTVVFLSDFLEAEDILPERLRFALSSRYESLCLQVLDREEEKLPSGDALRFVEMEGTREVSTSPEVIRDEFSNRMNEFKDTLERNLSSVSAEFESLYTDQDLGHALRRFLGVRNRNVG